MSGTLNHRRTGLGGLVAVLFGLLVPVGLAVADRDLRQALVIGNARYEHAQPLQNTVNDVRDIAQDLRGVGFAVTEVEDADLDTLIDAVDRFVADLHAQGGVGLLYYSGH